MKITKISLINGAYSLMRISGITVNPTPEDITLALSSADDYAAQLKAHGIDIGWAYPEAYGDSDPNDTAGIPFEVAGPFKKCLAAELLANFGKSLTPELVKIQSEGMRALENYFISVPDSQMPHTLPIGSGSEYSYTDNRFFPRPPNNTDADYVYKDDILNFEYDFSSWLVDSELVSATWEVANSQDGAITITNEAITELVASAELTFNRIGGYTICITATKTDSTDKLTVKKNFIIRECD